MSQLSTKESIRRYIEKNYEVIAELYVIDIDRFVDGSLVKIYLHSYGRISTFDKRGDIYLVNIEQIGINFIEKDEWRNKQLLKIEI
jgi:hypothetical protein